MHEHERLVQQIQQGQHAVIEVRRDLHEAVTQQQQAVEELHQQVVSSQRSLTLQQQHCDLLTEQVRDLAHAFEQTYNDLQEQGKRLQQEVELLRTTVMNQLQTAQQEVERKLSELDVDHRAHREQLRENLTTLVQQHHERVQDVLSVMGETLTRLDQSHDQLRQDVLTQQQAIVQLKEDLTALIGRQGREIKIALEQHVSQQAQERAELSNRLETIEQWREQLVAQAYQQRIDAQDQQIQALTRMLQDEREGRELLDEQLMVQKEQIQLLHREIEGLKQR